MMTKLIESLKKHEGPLNSDQEIDKFLERFSSLPEKELAKMLNEEIRFRRDSNLRYSISKDCYLYRQRGISNEQRVKNLRLLVQRPDARSSATIEDLQAAFNDIEINTAGSIPLPSAHHSQSPKKIPLKVERMKLKEKLKFLITTKSFD